MIIKSFQDLPTEYCLLCQEKLHHDLILDSKYCMKTEQYQLGEKSQYIVSHYTIMFNQYSVYLPYNMKISYYPDQQQMWFCDNYISIIELDFSNIPKLTEQLLTLINFL